jgi:hypothetical protein
VPLPLASPCGKDDDVEFSSSRALSSALAASTTTLARTWRSSPLALCTYETPVASPSRPTVTSRAIASVISVSLPVASAGAISTSGLEKLAFTEQPRLH